MDTKLEDRIHAKIVSTAIDIYRPARNHEIAKEMAELSRDILTEEIESRCIAAIEREKFADTGKLSDHDKLSNHRLSRAVRRIRGDYA